MLTSLLTRNPFRPRSSTTSNSTNSDAADPGFDTFIATLRARRSSDEWGKEGPEGDLYRLRCLAEEMTLLSERNYGYGNGRRKVRLFIFLFIIIPTPAVSFLSFHISLFYSGWGDINSWIVNLG